MQSSRIAELLKSHIVGLAIPVGLYEQLGAYLEFLLRWNAKTNLTAIRDPEQIVIRHFGESLFAAGILFGATRPKPGTTVADLGSGAGFPGLPIKLAFPELHVTLIESQNKKATFLKEVIRALRVDGIEVYSGRAEQWGKQADVVTVRAVEKFESVLPVATRLLTPSGRVCLLIGASQKRTLTEMSHIDIEVEETVPGMSDSMVVVVKYL